ncbi:MAG: DUF4105 domain-containing protein [Gemmatimonadaceae bacterium]|nr:DUF4105 domain-containing protein [Gemmatimonadaceae bacterium]
MRWSWRRALVAVTVTMVGAGDAIAQASPIGTNSSDMPSLPGASAVVDSLRAIRGASLTVSLYTYGPSDVFFERFGHAALGVRDSLTGDDVAYNWGIFDFDQPNFLGRFLTGDTKYSMAGYPTQLFNDVYKADNRTIRQQVLALSPVERAALFEFLQWNSREANKYYRYDYYRENCATKLRDALDRVLGGRLHPALNGPGTGRTWRGETARLLGSMLPMYAGIEVALGRRADQTLSQWDEEFLPEHMATHYAALVLSDASGKRIRLVQRDTTLFTADRVPLPDEAPDRLAMSLLLGLSLAGLVAVMADARARAIRVLLGMAVSIWYVVGGLLGTGLLLAATVTRHAPYMGANTTLLSLHPLLLVAAVMVPLSIARGVPTRAARGVSVVIALLALCGAALQAMPAFAQVSGVVLAVVVPVHVAIALAMWRLGHDRSRLARP